MTAIKNRSMTNKTSIQENGELKLFRALWNHSDDNMFVVLKDEFGDFITEKSNPTLVNLFNLHPKQASGCSLKSLLSEDSYQIIADRYNQCLETNEPISYEEAHSISDDKKPRYWSTMIIPVIDSETSEQRIFGISREITKLKRYEEQLKVSNEKLEVDVVKRTKELQLALKEMKVISQHDKLTGLFNRHKLDEDLTKSIEEARNSGKSFGLAMLDIDNFKEVNDSCGHHIGDKVLTEFSQLLKSSIRTTDVLGRWGGDEFLIITPNTNQEQMQAMAANIKAKLQKHQSDLFPSLSSSIGLTLYQNNDDIDSIVLRADKAMYTSKRQGKNKIYFI